MDFQILQCLSARGTSLHLASTSIHPSNTSLQLSGVAKHLANSQQTTPTFPSLTTYIDFQIPQRLGTCGQLYVVLFLDQFGDEALGQGVWQRLQRHLHRSAHQVLAAG